MKIGGGQFELESGGQYHWNWVLNITGICTQKYDFVLHYIAEKKLYDHQRFLPK